MSELCTVGVLGCGEITSKRTADSIASAENTELGPVMDVDADAARDIGERFDVPHSTATADVLEDEAVDAVYIATPHHLHAKGTIAAAEAGKHVLVEKPIAVSVAEADEMIAACAENVVALSVCMPRRYSPQVERAKELLEDGFLGDVVGIRVQVMVRKPDSYWTGGYTGRVETDWRTSREHSGGGVLNMNAIHSLDAVRYATGLEIARVYAELDTFATDVEVEDFCSVTLRYDNGAIGTVHASSFLEDAPRDRSTRGTRIYGTEGELVVEEPLLVRTNAETRLGPAEEWHEVSSPERRPSGVRLIEDFSEAVLGGTEPPITGRDGRAALEIVRAAYESGEKHGPVTL
ncbi:Gfo/Idh/MocA family protein [Natrononativus amylolyticus]|uniref:Gfo/Idh/MocA family protein n=1 Tax=Natrononativus amylolyticus TaxID=2963434 RepID=UPI0020CDCFA1|nr:Gfo/Idh/MocA family oxidoreductase [Natrononativus amylolyticus]